MTRSIFKEKMLLSIAVDMYVFECLTVSLGDCFRIRRVLDIPRATSAAPPTRKNYSTVPHENCCCSRCCELTARHVVIPRAVGRCGRVMCSRVDARHRLRSIFCEDEHNFWPTRTLSSLTVAVCRWKGHSICVCAVGKDFDDKRGRNRDAHSNPVLPSRSQFVSPVRRFGNIAPYCNINLYFDILLNN